MAPNMNEYEDWSLGDENEVNHSAGVPVDLGMITQAHETDDFWLPSPTLAASRITLDTQSTSKSSSTMTASTQRAEGIVDVTFVHTGSYVCRCVSSSSAMTKYQRSVLFSQGSFTQDPLQPDRDTTLTHGTYTAISTYHSYGLFHNSMTQLNPIKSTLLPVQLQPANPGSSSTSFMPQQHRIIASQTGMYAALGGNLHGSIPSDFGGHPHGYVVLPTCGGNGHDSSANHGMLLANEPSWLQTRAAIDAFHHRNNNNNNNNMKSSRGATAATCCARCKNNLGRSPLKCPSVTTKCKQCLASGSGIARSLTLYNFFFRVERNRLLQEVVSSSSSGGVVTGETVVVVDPNVSLQEFYAGVLCHPRAFIEQVLQDQWSRNPYQKRKHTKVHGKISFESLSRRIAANWQALPDSVKEVFRLISACDQRRYDQEVRNASSI
jgi:hypothetical protein